MADSDDNVLRFSKAQHEKPDWLHNAVLGETGNALLILTTAGSLLEWAWRRISGEVPAASARNSTPYNNSSAVIEP
jgi:hypothetical protein